MKTISLLPWCISIVRLIYIVIALQTIAIMIVVALFCFNRKEQKVNESLLLSASIALTLER